MRLYDTMQRSVVPIISAAPGLLRVYACGPTVYRDAHVGNMRTFLLTDLIRRTAEFNKVQVRLVQNITDVGHMADDTGLGVLTKAKATPKIACCNKRQPKEKGPLTSHATTRPGSIAI